MVLLAACDVPTPPPELPSPTPGSQNPENLLFTGELTPVRATPAPEFRPLEGPPGHIYFVRAGRLWRVAPDGSGETQLSDLEVTNPPAPSPDGKLVAFTSGREVYIVRSEGGEVRQVASGELALQQRLGWSTGGAMVGFISFDLSAGQAEQAWAVPVAGGEAQLIAALPRGAAGRGPVYERAVKWSPDGNWVAVAGANNPMLLLRWPLATGQPNDRREIAGGEPDWSPNSRDLVYTESLNGALGVFSALDSGATPFRNEQQLVGTRLGEYAQGPGPLWSPASSGGDADLIAYRSGSLQGEPQVAIRRRGGRELRPLPANTNNPWWSPSGDRLVVETGYVTKDGLGSKWVPEGLAIARINFDAGGEHTLTPLVEDAKWGVWGR